MKDAATFAIVVFLVVGMTAAYGNHIRDPQVREQGRRAGYAAAVDSVRAVEQKATRPHLIDLADVPYLVYVDRDSIVRVLRFGGHK